MFKTEHLGSKLSRQHCPELQDPVSSAVLSRDHWKPRFYSLARSSTLDQASGARKYRRLRESSEVVDRRLNM